MSDELLKQILDGQKQLFESQNQITERLNRIEAKIDILDKRLFENEAEISLLKRAK